MKLLSLLYENIRRITLASITLPESGVATINGANESGKSTLLKGIVWALRGKSHIDNPDTVVTEGERKGRIELHIGDDNSPQYIVDLRFRKGGPVLKVTAADGSPVRAQSTLLKQFWNDVAIDPLAFARSSASDQREVLLNAIQFNLDAEYDELTRDVADRADRNPVDVIDDAYNVAYESRRNINRELKQVEAQLGDYADVTTQADDVDVASVTSRRNELMHTKQKRDQLASAISYNYTEISRIDAEIARLQEQRDAKTRETSQLQSQLDDLPVVHDVEIAECDEALQNAARSERARAKRKLQERYNKLDEQSDELDEQVARIREYKGTMVANATMPIEGIAFDPDGPGILYEGEPLEARGVSRNLRIGAAIAASLNPDLRLILLDEGSELSDDSVRDLAAWATEHDLLVIMAREKPVDGDGVVSFEIHDGVVEGV